MKHIHLIVALFSFSLLASVTPGYAQRRLPDGTIIYGDGSRKLPNGTVVYPNGSNRNTRGVNRTIEDILYPNKNYPANTDRRGYDNRRNLPPGQAKKIYGGSARDYAPGHNKGNGNWKSRRDNERDENENWNRGRDNDHEGKGHGKSHGKKDK
jgi:hypothetical protein